MNYDLMEHDHQQKQLEEERLAHQIRLLLRVYYGYSQAIAADLASELGIRNEFLKHIGA